MIRVMMRDRNFSESAWSFVAHRTGACREGVEQGVEQQRD
jgi:hypothetical protein